MISLWARYDIISLWAGYDIISLWAGYEDITSFIAGHDLMWQCYTGHSIVGQCDAWRHPIMTPASCWGTIQEFYDLHGQLDINNVAESFLNGQRRAEIGKIRCKITARKLRQGKMEKYGLPFCLMPMVWGYKLFSLSYHVTYERPPVSDCHKSWHLAVILPGSVTRSDSNFCCPINRSPAPP